MNENKLMASAVFLAVFAIFVLPLLEEIAYHGSSDVRTVVRVIWIAVAVILFIIGFGVNGIAFLTRKSGAALRLTQTGQVQTYAFILVLGLTAIVFLSVLI